MKDPRQVASTIRQIRLILIRSPSVCFMAAAAAGLSGCVEAPREDWRPLSEPDSSTAERTTARTCGGVGRAPPSIWRRWTRPDARLYPGASRKEKKTINPWGEKDYWDDKNIIYGRHLYRLKGDTCEINREKKNVQILLQGRKSSRALYQTHILLFLF